MANKLSAWERVEIARQVERPKALDYINPKLYHLKHTL